MYWLIARIFFYILLCIGMWYGGQFYSAKKMLTTITAISTPVVFVDQSTLTDPHPASQYFDHYDAFTRGLLASLHVPQLSTIHNGSPFFPFLTIAEAITYAQTHHISTIAIVSGTYNESIILPENVTLLGYHDVSITYDQLSLQDVVTLGENSRLINLHVTGGKNAVNIPYRTNTTISNCTISNAKDYGIKMENAPGNPVLQEAEQEQPSYVIFDQSPETIAAIPLVLLRNLTVMHNHKQGMYLRDGRVEIHDSHISENDEEGIDLHPHLHTTITNTISAHNGEGGLETEIYDNIVLIDNSVFDRNAKSGIALLTSIGLGSITIQNSTITNNQQYGIRCARHGKPPKKPRPFFSSVITEHAITYENNVVAQKSPDCYTY